MTVGLIIAIERELKSFLTYGTDIRTEIRNNRTIYHTFIGRHEVIALKSGYGEIDAAAATQLLITAYDCEIIMNFGVTGALDRALKVDDLFVVRKACNHDYDVSPIDPVKKHQYAEFADEFIPLDEDLIRKAKAVFPALKEAAVASGERFVVDREDKLALNRLGCNICDMEIAAIARVCYLNQVRCLSVKCISDTFDGDGGDFNTNVLRSAEKAFSVLTGILKAL